MYQNISILKSGQLFWQSNYNWVVDRRNTPVEDLIRSQLKSEKDYNWVVDRKNTPVEDLIRSQLKSEKEFTVQHSSHFKMCIAVNFKSLQKKICPKL